MRVIYSKYDEEITLLTTASSSFFFFSFFFTGATVGHLYVEMSSDWITKILHQSRRSRHALHVAFNGGVGSVMAVWCPLEWRWKPSASNRFLTTASSLLCSLKGFTHHKHFLLCSVLPAICFFTIWSCVFTFSANSANISQPRKTRRF